MSVTMLAYVLLLAAAVLTAAHDGYVHLDVHSSYKARIRKRQIVTQNHEQVLHSDDQGGVCDSLQTLSRRLANHRATHLK
jgi:hypothetical protein